MTEKVDSIMVRKRVAILTLYYKNANYGGALQAFALQQALQKHGFHAEQISYVLDSGYKRSFSQRLKLKLRPFYRFPIDANWNKYHRQFEESIFPFLDKIPHTGRFTAQSIANIDGKFDAYICGSDQIWNPIGWQPTLFLSFVHSGKKIAYAASVARGSLTESETKYIQKYTDDFDALSVREGNTAEFLNNSSIVTSKFVTMPDPTFLLSSSDWNELIPQENLIDEDYIFAYFLGTNIAQREAVVEYADQHRLKLVMIPYIRRETFEWDRAHGPIMRNGTSVEDLINLIRGAKLVVTDSFHGTVFSIINRRPFVVLKRAADVGGKSMQSRLSSLLTQVDMENRYADNLDVQNQFDLSRTDVVNISSYLELAKNRGLKFLKNAIGEGLNEH